MKQVATIMQFKNVELNSILTFIHQESHKISRAYGDILKQAVEQYLGRDFDPIADAPRLLLNTYQNTNQTDILIDDKLIGSISTIVAYNNDDFVNNKQSIKISFTPIT